MAKDKIDLYLDLDGVILRRTGGTDPKGRTEFEVAIHAFEFLAWCVENFRCYWLTSRSHDGGHEEIERAFRFAIPATSLPTDVRDLIQAITPAPWHGAKISGIDMSREFIWLDDNPDDVSLAKLQEENMAHRFVRISTDQSANDLQRVKQTLEELVTSRREVS
jgi:hypothetical protein